jgi:uncharacterized protein
MQTIFKLLFFMFFAAPLCAQQTIRAKLDTDTSQYNIQDSILVKTRDGDFISVMLVTKKEAILPLPVLFQFTIYVDYKYDLRSLKAAADRGYAGVMAYTRGKNYSASELMPYEKDGKDAYDVLDWMSHQVWCNGKVGMYGGSYNGFTQWAVAKYNHPILKTIMPLVSAIPGLGLPMENNIFINPNYQWSFYVSNNKQLDRAVNNDRVRFNKMEELWWQSGKAYRKIDSIDGQPNKILQNWLKHPDYDSYWQNMIPYKTDFANITIPVLTVDGYYNDSQISGLHYYREHMKYNKNAENYLIIGPYSHFGAQIGGDTIVNGYKVDSVALIGIRNIRYQWMDYILKGAAKPKFLKDKINYQLMGTNTWQQAKSLEQMSDSNLVLYFDNTKYNQHHLLNLKQPDGLQFLSQTVDFNDRTTSNDGFYPDQIIRDSLNNTNGFSFITAPFETPIAVNGAFSGEIKVRVNKKDFDWSVAMYEVMPNGKYFQLSYFVGRASYAKKMEKRKLLKPNAIVSIPFERSRFVSKQLSKGSRLLVVLNVIKTSAYQINYGTGKDVSDETISDAAEPLQIEWYNHSFIKVPILKKQ